MRETLVENKLIGSVKKKGGLCWKFVSPGTNGVPDRVCLFPDGRIVFVETKAPGGKPEPIQEYRHQQLRDLGFEVRVIDSKEEAANAF